MEDNSFQDKSSVIIDESISVVRLSRSSSFTESLFRIKSIDEPSKKQYAPEKEGAEASLLHTQEDADEEEKRTLTIFDLVSTNLLRI